VLLLQFQRRVQNRPFRLRRRALVVRLLNAKRAPLVVMLIVLPSFRLLPPMAAAIRLPRRPHSS
jgi:hypothetical protein